MTAPATPRASFRFFCRSIPTPNGRSAFLDRSALGPRPHIRWQDATDRYARRRTAFRCDLGRIACVSIAMNERSEPGEHPAGLSELQRAILRRFAEGGSSAQVARGLAISEATMRRNLQEARDALGATSTANAIYIATKSGLI